MLISVAIHFNENLEIENLDIPSIKISFSNIGRNHSQKKVYFKQIIFIILVYVIVIIIFFFKDNNRLLNYNN